MIEVVDAPLSPDRKAELVSFLCEKFWQVKLARQNQVDGAYKRWMANYDGKPKEEVRSTPFYNASNFVPQLIRMHADILTARISGIVFGTSPFWRPSSLLSDIPHEALEVITDALQWASFHDIPRFQQTMLSIIRRALKHGSPVVKYPWTKDSVWKMRTEGQGRPVAKEIIKEGMDFRPIPFDDFWPFPLTAECLADCSIQFHRIRFTKEGVESRKRDGWWNKEATDTLLKAGPQSPGEDETRQQQADTADIELTSDVIQPYWAIEAWLDWEIEVGKSFSIVVVFDPRTKSAEGLLKCYYAPYECCPTADFHMFPREDLFYDYNVPEILEQAQEEQAQIHNARRDTSAIVNTPGWKKKRGANVPNPSTTWYPNKVFELDDMNDLEPLQLAPQYNAMMDEENAIMSQAERYTGVSAAMQGYGSGVSSGKRGIYNTGGTLALLAAGNDRLDLYLKTFRDPMHHIGKGIFCSYRDFGQAKLERFKKYANYSTLQELFSQSRADVGGGLFFGISASDSSANKEIDRTSLLLMANTMASYYQRVFEAGSTIAQLPPDSPVRELLLLILDGARDLTNRLLYSFDVGDRKRLVPDVRTVLAGSAEGAASAAEQAGLPPNEQPLSTDRLRQFAGNVSDMAAGARR